MFSKKICASLCALGLSLGAANVDTKVSAANTFAGIAMKGNPVSCFYNYFKFVIGICGFMTNVYKREFDKNYGKSGSFEAIAGFSAWTAVEGFLGMIFSRTSEDEAKMKTFEAIAENDPVCGATYEVLRSLPIELSDKKVKDVIDNVKMGQEALNKVYDRNLDSAERLLAKDTYDDVVNNLVEIAGTKNSKSTDKQNDSNEPQLYKGRNR